MRRAEMARRRKNLSEKRNEEEKMDTINRLLKKQAPKRRGKISAAEIAAQGAEASKGGSKAGDNTSTGEVEVEVERANPVFARWVSGREGLRLGVPQEWEGSGAGRVFGGGGWKGAVEEVEG
jgi:Ino eighty subunit 2